MRVFVSAGNGLDRPARRTPLSPGSDATPERSPKRIVNRLAANNKDAVFRAAIPAKRGNARKSVPIQRLNGHKPGYPALNGQPCIVSGNCCVPQFGVRVYPAGRKVCVAPKRTLWNPDSGITDYNKFAASRGRAAAVRSRRRDLVRPVRINRSARACMHAFLHSETTSSMTRKISITISVLALTLAGAGLLPAGQPLRAAQPGLPAEWDGQPFPSLAPLVDTTKPAVVSIAIARPARNFQSPFRGDPFFERFFPDPPRQEQRQTRPLPAGSGVIVDSERGLVLTNHHVINNATEIVVTLSDQRSIDAKVIGSDPGTDIALLELEETDNLTQMPLGDSDQLQVGDFVLAIGNPFGLTHTVTSGIVSALGRTIGRAPSQAGRPSPIENFIQTDASINPGNSGGALVNMRGQLIGIPSNILSRSGDNAGIGFAIPTSIASEIMRQLVAFGEVRRGRLGVILGDLDQELADTLGLDEAGGAIVTEVVPDSAAEEAGIEPGDVIVRVNSKKITNSNDVVNAVGLRAVGEEVTLEIVGEDGRSKVLQATLGGLVTATGGDIHPALDGASLADSDEGEYEGVLVETVEEGSIAQRSGLRADDMIVAVNRIRVRNIEQFKKVADGQPLIVLSLRRGNRTLVLPLRS